MNRGKTTATATGSGIEVLKSHAGGPPRRDPDQAAHAPGDAARRGREVKDAEEQSVHDFVQDVELALMEMKSETLAKSTRP